MGQEQPENATAIQSDGMLDRTVTLLKKFNLYLLTLATVMGGLYALHKAAEIPDKYIYVLVSVPFLLLLLFEVLPHGTKNIKSTN